ncbi:hypothetical protein FI667_g16738, partial [Globisporangium splendens]
MLRRKPTRVEDRADVAEEYEFYLQEREKGEQQQSTRRAFSGAEDVRMDGAEDDAKQQQRQSAAVRNMTRTLHRAALMVAE